jgi:hypothetical protein
MSVLKRRNTHRSEDPVLKSRARVDELIVTRQSYLSLLELLGVAITVPEIAAVATRSGTVALNFCKVRA